MPRCTHCATEYSNDARVCPNCGTPAVNAPLPELTGESGKSTEKTLTPYRWVDFSLGFLLSLVTYAMFFIGGLVGLALYFALRPNYPVFARGIGWGLLIPFVLLLGAVALCFGAIAIGSMGNLGH